VQDSSHGDRVISPTDCYAGVTIITGLFFFHALTDQCLGVDFYNKRLSVMGNRGFNRFWGYYAKSDDLNNDRLTAKE